MPDEVSREPGGSRWDVLTQTEAGTPMGDLLRRYWQPIAGASELDDIPTKPVRLLGEDLVLYKDLAGQYGLLDRHCPHRSADLCYGIVEACGLRCNYHGWLLRRDGACLEQPYRGHRRIPRAVSATRSASRPTRSRKAGLLWAYLGPEPAPLVPNWEPSPGTTASCRSSMPRSRATGSSARRTRSTRCISNGCIELERAARRAATAPMRHATSRWSSTSSTTASYKRVREDSDEDDPAVDRRPGLPVAERAVHRQPFRMARADRRRRTR